MSRALVLGGGGPLGIGWQAGLLAALADAGVALGQADAVVGTSAGSVVGAQLTSDRPLADVVAPITKAPPWAPDELADAAPDLAALLALGERDLVPEEDFVAHFSFLGGAAWPEKFRCTGYALDTARFALWDRAAGVELHRAVAASCSVPGIVPPVTIAGERYVDGGVRDMLNADLAIGHDVVVAVSCVALDPPHGAVPELLAGLLAPVRERIEELRSAGGEVAVVEPSDEVQELSGWGRHLMDFARTPAAFDAGVRQGKAEADRLGSIWAS
jgi:NTE family protein